MTLGRRGARPAPIDEDRGRDEASESRTPLADGDVERVADAVRALVSEPHDFLIVHADSSRNYYVQLLAPEERATEIYCEATADRWLEPSHRIGTAGARLLRLRGWSDPDSRHENWHRVMKLDRTDDTYVAIALEVVETLRDVYRLERSIDTIEFG